MEKQRLVDLRGWALVALIVAIGAILRTAAIGAETLWGDEGLTIVLARLPLFDLFFRPVDPTPGLYYALHKLLVPSHANAVMVRLPSLIAGVLTIPAGYWLGRAALGRSAGYAVAWLVAVSWPLVDYSQEARAYSLLVLLITLSAAALIDAFPTVAPLRPVRWDRLGIFAFAGILAVYTHLVGWFWLIPASVLALIEADRRRAASRPRLFLLAALGAALVLPEFIRSADYAVSGLGDFTWLSQSSYLQFLALLDLVLLPIPSEIAALWLNPVGTALLTGLRNIALLFWVYLALRPNLADLGAKLRRRHVAAIVVLIFLSIPIASWLVGFVIRPMLMVRTVLPALPGLFLLFAALAHLKGGRRAIFLLVAASAASTAGMGLQRHKEQWATVAQVIAANSDRQSLILFCPTWRAPAFLATAEMSGFGGPPVVVFKDGMARRVSVDFGSDPDWTDRFVNLALRPALPAYARLPSSVRQLSLVKLPRRVIIVRSECPIVEDRAMMAWLGRGEVRIIRRLDVPSTTISIFHSRENRTRPLIIERRN